MESKIDIATQKLQSIPTHLMDDVIKFLDFLQFKSSEEKVDPELEAALDKAIQEANEGKTVPHNEVMASLRKKHLS